MLPRGFRAHAAKGGTCFYEDINQLPSEWVRLWNISPFDLTQPGVPKNARTRVSFRRYLTPKFGKPGWNLRVTYPEKDIRKGIGFVLVEPDGTAYRFAPRKEMVRR